MGHNITYSLLCTALHGCDGSGMAEMGARWVSHPSLFCSPSICLQGIQHCLVYQATLTSRVPPSTEQGSPRTKTHLQGGFSDPLLAAEEAQQSPALSMGKSCSQAHSLVSAEEFIALRFMGCVWLGLSVSLVPCFSQSILNSFLSSYTHVKYAKK